FLIVLSVLVVAFISCKDNKSTDPTTFKVSSIVGTWTSTLDAANTFTVSDAGALNITVYGLTIPYTISDWASVKDSDVGEYKISLTQGGSTYYFTFKDANNCELSMEGQAAVEPFTK
ncbi:hypothetical protein, partial [Brachyspira catarrhinii]|uniref:hypothetical protein n=1 Tax=Brachyspira catarrhinii TaxID=2528966 RepID=UPI001387593B